MVSDIFFVDEDVDVTKDREFKAYSFQNRERSRNMAILIRVEKTLEHKKGKVNMDLVIQRLYEVIKSAQLALEEYRKACKHPTYRLGMFSWRVGAHEPSRICEKCESQLPGITDEEALKVQNDWHQTKVIS